METEKYKALVTAIDTGSFASAAEKLGYTTSGISRMMAALEEESGFELLVRSKNGVRPTSRCEEILPEIRDLLRSADRLGEKESSMQGVISGTVRIGTAYNYYYPMLSKAVKQFAEQYPKVLVEIENGYSTNLAQELYDRKLDIAIISRRDTAGGWIPLLKDDMVAAVSSENPLAEKKTFPVSAFAKNPYIKTHPDADSDSARIFRKCGVIPNTKYTTEDSMATFSMVAADLGITMNNRLNTMLWKNADITVIPLRPHQKIEIGIAVSDEAGEAAESFLQTILEEVM